MVVDIMLRTQNGHCSLCGRAEDKRYVIQIRSGLSVNVVESDAHDAACLTCMWSLGLRLRAITRNLKTHLPPPRPRR